MSVLAFCNRVPRFTVRRQRAAVCCALACGLLSAALPLAAQISADSFPDGAIELKVEKSLAELFTERIEENVEETTVQRVEDDIENRVLTLGGYPEGYIQTRVEETVEERVLSLGGYPEGYIESLVQRDVEETVEETVADSVAESVEESVTEVVEEVVDEAVAENVGETIEESIVENIEEDIVDDVQDLLEESVSDNIEGDIEQGIVEDIGLQVAAGVEDSLEGGVESEIDQLLQDIESELDVDEDRIHKNQWLVMAEKEVFEELAKEGYLFDKVTDLPGIGLQLAEVAAPSSFDISVARQGVVDVVGAGRAKVDLNHIYTAGVPVPSSGEGVSPRAAISVPADTQALPLRIGMIDSRVDTSHPALHNSNIRTRSFVAAGSRSPDFHGTAIASIIAADSPSYTGLAPNAMVFAASVFEEDEQRGEFASTVSLVRALDWLVTSGANVVNVSLAGPPNRLLQAALEHTVEKGVLIVAAAGNGGPMAKPMYPAAYDSVIAVTAVDMQGKVFRLANRGEYLDLAAPGVNLQHAQAGGGYTASSGTSFAVPFAAIAAARIRELRPSEDARQLLNRSAKDLGAPGRDEVYGYGLLQLSAEQAPIQFSMVTSGR